MADRATLRALEGPAFREAVLERAAAGGRVAALAGLPAPAGGASLLALMAYDDRGALEAVLSSPLSSYRALTPDLPQAHVLERELFEQHGVLPEGHPWMKPVRRTARREDFFTVQGEAVHEVAVGPVHAGIIDPGHFRFQCHGETVLHLQIQLGYQHRGVEEALQGGPGPSSAILAETIAGDTTIGHAVAHAQVVEALAGCEPPPRAEVIRALALELERAASHAGDLGAMAGDVGFLPAASWFGRLRGDLLNLLMAFTGSRFGRSLVRPGGVRHDLTEDMARGIAWRLRGAEEELAPVAHLLFETPSVRARLEGTGPLSKQAAAELGLLGPAARACGSPLDARKDHPWGPYRAGGVLLPEARSGDVLARAQVRWSETRQSVRMCLEWLGSLPHGPIRTECGAPRPGRIAAALVEGWRGEIVHLAVTGPAGRFERYKVKDPSLQNWPGLALAMRQGAISDFPLCNKSFNLSYAGHDL